jgi:hypothetical protein
MIVRKSTSVVEAVNKGDPSKPIGNEASIATAIKSSRSKKSGNTDRKDKSWGSRFLRVDSHSDSNKVRDWKASSTVLMSSKVGKVGIICALSSKTSSRPNRDDNSKYLIHIEADETWEVVY